MFQGVSSRESERSKRAKAAAKEVADADALADKAKRQAEEVRRRYEEVLEGGALDADDDEDFVKPPPPSRTSNKKKTEKRKEEDYAAADAEEEDSQKKKKKSRKAEPEEEEEEDEEEAAKEEERRVVKSINKYIGSSERSADEMPMDFKTFTLINGGTTTPIKLENYNAKAEVTKESVFNGLKKEDKRADNKKELNGIASTAWSYYKERVLKRCDNAGRITVFSAFVRQNSKYMKTNKIDKSELWKKYNAVWDVLCGTVLKRISTTKRDRKKATPVVVAAEEEDDDDVVDEEVGAGVEESDVAPQAETSETADEEEEAAADGGTTTDNNGVDDDGASEEEEQQ